jgi:hypothetical protein
MLPVALIGFVHTLSPWTELTTVQKSFLQAPRGLSVRAFKGPTLSSHPFTTTDKYDVSYRPTSHAEPWQAANWATAPRTLAARTSSVNLNDMLAGYVDSSSSMPCVERLPSAQTRRLSAYQNDIYDRSVPPNPYPHNNPDPYVRYGTPYPSLHPLDGSTQSLMGSAESDDFESNAHIPSSPPLSVRHLIPPAVPHLREARSGAVIFGDPTQGYPPFSVSESFTCAPFIGLSSLPPSARSDSDDDTVVAPEEHDGGFKSGYTANGQDVYGTTFIPAGPPEPGSHPVHVTRSDYDDRQNNHLMPAAPPNLGDGAHGVVSFQQTSTWPGQPFPPPSRRHTDPGQTRPPPPTVPERSRRLSMSAPRCVRWNENLICPSPILSSQRRKGWFNRRGYCVVPYSPLTAQS